MLVEVRLPPLAVAADALGRVEGVEAVLEVGEELSVPENPVCAVIFRALVCPDHVADELAVVDTLAQSPQVLENVLSPLFEVVL